MTSESNSNTSTPRRWSSKVIVPLGLLFLAVLPDTLPYPGIKTVVSERFNRSDPETQLFILASLLGALFAIPVLRMVRNTPPALVILCAGLLEAVVIGAMAFSIPWWALIALRLIQGGFDLLTLAILVGIIARGIGSTGKTFGLVGSLIMAGLACGFPIGGIIASTHPDFVFPASALCAGLLGLGGYLLSWEKVSEPESPKKSHLADEGLAITVGMACNASDRFLAGISTVILPLLLAGSLGMNEQNIGIVMGAPLMMAVLGGFFAGIVVDRFDASFIRVIGCTLYAIGLSMLVLGAGMTVVVIIATGLMGFGITTILPTPLVIGTQNSGPDVDSETIGRIQVGGQIGYIVGSLTGAGMTVIAGSTMPVMIVIAAGLYLAWNGFWLAFGIRFAKPMVEEELRSAN